jgi:hypothetical protein
MLLKTRMAMISKSIGMTALVGAIACLSGTSFVPTPALAQQAMPTPKSEIFLVKIQFRGGMRANATIPELLIRPDGLYRSSNRVSQPKSGVLSHQELRLLKQRIKQADFKAIKSKPFKGTCPIAYDGTEVVYLFQLHQGIEEISTCKYSINGKSPLFQQLNRVIQKLSN